MTELSWAVEKDRMQRDMLKKVREVSNLKRAKAAAHDQMIAAQTRAHDLKIRAKSAEGSQRAIELELSRTREALREALNMAILFTGDGHSLDERIAALRKEFNLE